MSEDSKASPQQSKAEVDGPSKLDAALARAMAEFPRSRDLMRPFLDAYRETESITMACEQVGISRATVWEWRKNEDFRIVFTDNHLKAQAKNNDLLRKTAIQLSTVGSPHWVMDKKTGMPALDANGRRIVAYYDHYPQLIAFMLKNRLPNEFKDKFEHEINTKLVTMLVSEFISIIKRQTSPDITEKIQKELETSLAKMTVGS